MRPSLAAALLALCIPSLAGCLGTAPGALLLDQPLALPQGDFFAREGRPAYSGGPLQGTTPANPPTPFHTLDEVAEHVAGYAAAHPGLARVEVVGASREGRPLWDVVLTDPAAPGPKPTILLDGAHHGNEIAGMELVLFVADFLLGNARTNATVASLLRDFEVHLVPLVNPDGYVLQTRGNALGVNLNRNYDLDWGNFYGASNPAMGQLAYALQQPVPSVPIAAENAGPAPFSEPESQAMRDLLARLDEPGLAFYLTMHTPTNGIVAPWGAGDPPFEIPPDESAVFEHELQWIRDHTEYAAGKANWGNFSAGLPYANSGNSQDYVYARHRAAAYTLEVEIWVTSIVDPDFVERNLAPYDGLEYWMLATLPIPWHMLVNAREYLAWELAEREAPLPEGVPPPVPAGGWELLRLRGMERWGESSGLAE